MTQTDITSPETQGIKQRIDHAVALTSRAKRTSREGIIWDGSADVHR